MDKRKFYNKYDAGKTFFWSVVLPQIVGLLFIFILTIVASGLKKEYNDVANTLPVTIISVVISQLAFCLLFFSYNKIYKINYKRATGFCFKQSWRNYIGCILIAVVALFGLNNIIGVFDEIITVIGYKGATSLPLPLDNFGWLLFNIVFLAVVPAVFEELLFRGMIFNGLKKYGKIKAVFISALLFMVMHGTLVQSVYPFLLGVILGFVMLKTKNILFPIIVHFFNNCLVFIMSYIGNKTNQVEDTTTSALSLSNILFAILFFALAVGIIFVIIKFVLKSKQEDNIKLEDINIDNGNINFEQVSQIKSPIQISEANGLARNKFMFYGIIIAICFWVLDLLVGFGLIL